MARPTRIGGAVPLLTYALGYNPDADLGDEPDPIDHGLGAEMYFPFAIGSEDPAWIQSKFGRDSAGTVSITFDDPLTPGGRLLCMVFQREGVGAVFTPSGSGWTLVEREYTGAAADAWPMAMYTRPIELGDGTSWSVGSTVAGSCAVFAEVSAASALDAEIGFSGLTAAATDTLTPVTTSPVILVSMVSVRSDTDIDFTPATGMTEVHDEHQATPPSDNGPQIAVNYRVISAPSGGYTVGSTGGGAAQKALIGVSLTGTAGDVYWLAALNANDGSDATFDYIDDASLTDASLVAIEVAYAEARRFASARLRIALTTAGSITYSIEASNSSDFTGAVELDSVTFTATGSLTAQDVAFGWVQTTGYQYYRLVASATDDIRIHTFSMYEALEGTSYHPDLTGRDEASQHPATAVSVSPTVAGGATVQAALEALEAADLDLANTVVTETAFGQASAAGVATTASKGDHTHGTPTTAALQTAGHYELLMTGASPPEPLEDGTGTDWLWVWVN